MKYTKIKILLLLFIFMISPIAFAGECTILLHGMGRTHVSMELIEKALKEQGHSVWNKNYESTEIPIKTLADIVINNALDDCAKVKSSHDKINFVTHSLGGILVRAYLQDKTINNLGRVVMLSPPNHGSEIVDLLKDNFIYQKWMGPVGQQIGRADNSVPNQLKPIQAEIGVIAGSSTSDPWFSPFIPGDDDGKVSVESTRLDEMKDFIVIESGHSFIMRNKEAIQQILNFLEHGHFCHPSGGKDVMQQVESILE